MKHCLGFLFALSLGGLLMAAPGMSLQEPVTAQEIVQAHTSRNAVNSEVEFVTIVTIDRDSNISRHAVLFCTQKDECGHYDYLIRVVMPEQFSGVGLLAKQKDKGEIERYFYLPALGKVKRIVGRGKSPRFLGSNFTYEDLMKESPERYTYERLPDAVLDGVATYVLRARMTGLEEGDEPTYAYRDIYFDKPTFNILKIDFVPPGTDEPAKTLLAYDYNSIKVDGPTMRPLRAEMRDHENGSVSVLTVMRSRFNQPLNPDLFTTGGLTSWSEEQKEQILSLFRKDDQN